MMKDWKILIIDDSEMDFLITSAMLTKMKESNFSVHWAQSFQEGLDMLLSEQSWDAALVDYVLNEQTGIELIKTVRSKKVMIPLVLLTASEERAVDLEAMHAGVDGFLSKERLNPGLIERTLRYARVYRHNQVQIAQLNEALEQKIDQRTKELIQSNYALQEAEQRGRLLKEIASLANAASTVEDVLSRSLEKVADYTGWPVGHIFFYQEQPGKALRHLFSTDLWYTSHSNYFESFVFGESHRHLLPWEGLPGQVYCARKPYWYNFNQKQLAKHLCHRSDTASAYGLQSHLGFPIIVENEVVAVLEFFSLTDEKPVALLLDLMAQIGHELGYVLKRKRIEVELQKVQLAAEAANHAKSVFLASMSHEIRTPMNAILGTAQLMQRLAYENPKHEKYIQTILRAGEHLLTLINEILEMSKIEAGLMPINLTDFDLRNFVEDLRMLFKEQFRRLPDVAFEIEISETVPAAVFTDAGKLRQIILNLLGNALKFTRHGSIVLEVSFQPLSDQSGLLNVAVHDTGMGIAADEIHKLFKSFEQTASGRQQGGGTGLGLALCEKYIHLLNGKMFVTSEAGFGSTFGLSLPVDISTGTAIIKNTKMYAQVVGLAPDEAEWRVLVIDDEATNREIVLDFLEPLGFKLKEASSATEGLSMIESWFPHLVLMDVSMPVMNGLELTRLIRQEKRFAAIKIIMLTANAFEDERLAALAAGADDFLAKPFDANLLFEQMAKNLDLKYVFKTDSESPDVPVEATKGSLTLEDIPKELLHNLLQATLEADLDLLIECTTQLTHYNPQLSETIQKAAADYDYQRIADILEASP